MKKLLVSLIVPLATFAIFALVVPGNVKAQVTPTTVTTTTDSGCGAGYLYSVTTGARCPTTTDTGCVPGGIYSSTTGARCPVTQSVPTIDQLMNPQPNLTVITPCFNFSKDLQLGSRNKHVAALQTFLVAKGFPVSDLTVGRGSRKGYFGLSTYEALKGYQASVGLVATGFFGPQTRAFINTSCSNPVVDLPVVSTSDARAKVIDSSLLMSYGYAQKESLLISSFTISVDGGSTGVYIYKQGGGSVLVDQNGNRIQANSQSTLTLEALTPVEYRVDTSGQTFFIVPAGSTARFTGTATVKPEQMFAGLYYASLISLWANPNTTDITKSFNLQVPDNRTSVRAIVGEVSPYLTSVATAVNAGDKMSLFGVRLNDSTALGLPKVYIDGNIVSGVDGSKDGTLVFFVQPSFTSTSGQHYVYVSNANGDSNRLYFTVGTPVTPAISLKSVRNNANNLNSYDFIVTSIGSAFDRIVFRPDCNASQISLDAKGGMFCNENLTIYSGTTQYSFLVTFSSKDGINHIVFMKVTAYAKDSIVGSDSNDIAVIASTSTNGAPSITVISPNGGETFKTGSSILADWNMNYNSDTVQVHLYNPLNGDAFVSQYLPSSVGRNQFNINLRSVPEGQYKVNVCDNNQSPPGLPGKSLCDLSNDYFTITSATGTSPTITVLSPNGGETWTKGTNETRTIRWSTNNIPSTNNMTVRLRSVATGQELLSTENPNIGYSIMNIPADFAEGPYNVEVKTSVNGTSYMDSSDSYFKITSPPVSFISGTTTLVSANEDKVGSSETFTPGTGISGRNAYDWHWDVRLSASNLESGQSKHIKSMTLYHNTYGEGWSTSGSANNELHLGLYPLMVVRNGSQTSSYDQDLSIIPDFKAQNSYTSFDLYGQTESQTFIGGRLVITFTDGTTATIAIPASTLTPPASVLTPVAKGSNTSAAINSSVWSSVWDAVKEYVEKNF